VTGSSTARGLGNFFPKRIQGTGMNVTFERTILDDDVLQGKIPNAEDLQKLPYTRAILNESMRFRPPAGILLRKVARDTEVDGYFLKAGRLAIFSIFISQFVFGELVDW